jgi:serine-type D-Ala-D-Ala carboxypeptidase/endopeptidase (penicillin-binding protein 4)
VGSRRGAGVAALIVVLLVLGAAAALLTRYPSRDLDRGAATPATRSNPTPTGTPTSGPGLLDPARAAAAPVLAGLPSQVPPPTNAGLAAALGQLLGADRLGPDVGAVVLDAATGALLLDHAGAVPRTPASTAKLLTGAAALRVLGPQTRLTTTVVRGSTPGEVVLVGGGDPLLSASAGPASLRELARVTAAALRSDGVTTVRVAVDDSLFAAPMIAPGWEKQYVPSGVVAPVSALMVDQARTTPAKSAGAPTGARHADPALAAGTAFATMLAAEGLSVSAQIFRSPAPPDAARLAAVDSMPIADMVERMLTTSDNDIAEALARQVAIRTGAPATFDGAGAATVAALQALGVPTEGVHVADGSGLARSDAVPAQTLARVLAVAASPDHPELRALLTGLPVAGFNGTLADRFTDGTARGVVRAKTGTLTGVSTLAGSVVDADGSLLVFAVLADEVPVSGTLAARRALDAVASALAGCGCR